MIVTRTPLRISIGGGGTDLPSYYREFGGFVISAAIKRYVFIALSRAFFPGYFLKYSAIEHVLTRGEVRHPLIREALEMLDMPDHLDIASFADVPAGTGLGSSGSFVVGLLHALHVAKRERVTAQQLAEEAVEIEMVRLDEPVGKQDQYIAACGGLLVQDYRTDDSVGLSQLKISDAARAELKESLMLFFVGSTRAASALLGDQKVKLAKRDQAMVDSLHFNKQLGQEIGRLLEAGDIAGFGRLMHEHWLRKRCRSAGMSSERVDHLYAIGREKGGATGGKLVGAGGSGFLLFHTRDRKRLRKVMQEAGLSETEIEFDFDGSTVLIHDL